MTGSGQQLYSVDLRPVIAAEGSIPMFRGLSEGLTGSDVRQLQSMLDALGYLKGFPDGIFGSRTRDSVVRWQQHLKLEPTGVVDVGDVVFLSRLPALLSVDPATITVGASVVGGEIAVRATSADPVIQATFASDQFGVLRTGLPVVLKADAGDWRGRVDKISRQEDGAIVADFVASDGSACGVACPFTRVSDSPLEVSGVATVVPRTSGTIVPTVAISSRGAKTFVTRASGSIVPVTVIASAGGDSVVSGISAGATVRVRSEGDR